jgi:hypothetical protein
MESNAPTLRFTAARVRPPAVLRVALGHVLGVVVALLAASSGLAHAQSCAMLPPGRPGDGPAPPPNAQTTAVEAVTRALSGDGLTVIPSQDAQRRMLGETFAECNALECGGSVTRSLGVDFAVLVTVWAPRGTPTSVVVTLIGANDSAAGDAPIEGGDVSAATLSALTVARQRWQASQMGFLVVRTTPEGADVEVDGRLVGQTPVRYLVMAGGRQVRVHLEGHRAVEQEVRIEATQEQVLDLTLTAGTDDPIVEPPTTTPETRFEPHFANWLVGGALIAGGVAALLSPIVTLATGGQCADSSGLPMDWCRSEVRFGATSGVLLGVGLAALAGGVVFLAAQPFQLTTSVTPDSAMLQLRGMF